MRTGDDSTILAASKFQWALCLPVLWKSFMSEEVRKYFVATVIVFCMED